MSVKIQIASLEALERLLGGDTNVEIEIRNSIVQNFARKHLKAIANSETVKLLSAEIKNQIKSEYFTEKKVGWSTQIELIPEHKQKINVMIDDAIGDKIASLVRENLDIEKLRSEIKTTLERQAKWVAAELTNACLEERLNKMVDEKLKSKLGIK